MAANVQTLLEWWTLIVSVTAEKSGKESEVAQLCPILCDPMDCSLSGSSAHGIFPGKNTGMGCHLLLQDIFLTRGLNPGLSIIGRGFTF